ncbi:hypothetical protein THAOC_29331 [Thalassiosira oceanica]|uniref:Transmembrane protein n=1 Tax=Thalassiosira oceanica TaxID=159749 RepID=K0RCN8_THAOC|nr:hypothetical protein THAOC_29331 [Thalassiosira oceanica]|eukprot:EJK51488.1 hypothetical protein THAOC_29331 [Thalassiosira oceanica]
MGHPRLLLLLLATTALAEAFAPSYSRHLCFGQNSRCVAAVGDSASERRSTADDNSYEVKEPVNSRETDAMDAAYEYLNDGEFVEDSSWLADMDDGAQTVARIAPDVDSTSTATEVNTQYSRPTANDMLDEAMKEQQFRSGQVFEERERQRQAANNEVNKLDPLIATLARSDESPSGQVPMRRVPFFGELPADDSLAILSVVAGGAALGLFLSFVVAFQKREEIVGELSNVKIPEMKYTERVPEPGECWGICGSRDGNFDTLRES